MATLKEYVNTQYIVLKNAHATDTININLEKKNQSDFEKLSLPAGVSIQLERVAFIEFDDTYDTDLKRIHVNDIVGFFFP